MIAKFENVKIGYSLFQYSHKTCVKMSVMILVWKNTNLFCITTMITIKMRTTAIQLK